MRTAHPVWLLLGLSLLYGCSAGGGGQGADGEIDLAAGRELYAQNCAVCHGQGGVGTDQGPPFLHEVYVPSHHADASFQAAVARGVQPHHWDFGQMAPIPSLSPDEVADITAHVRQLQAEAGLIDDSAG